MEDPSKLVLRYALDASFWIRRRCHRQIASEKSEFRLGCEMAGSGIGLEKK
jgi:hypothetical protein